MIAWALINILIPVGPHRLRRNPTRCSAMGPGASDYMLERVEYKYILTCYLAGRTLAAQILYCLTTRLRCIGPSVLSLRMRGRSRLIE